MSQKPKLPLKPKKKEPHTHTTSREQWHGQVQAILDNIDSMEKEYVTYTNLYNTTMKMIIRKNIATRKSQLKQKLSEVPAKDRPQDIANNKWCREC